MGEESSKGIVYLLTNPAMPGLVKIGKTSRGSVDGRVGQLYTTGVPLPFECEYAARVKDESAVEKALHDAFEPNRINPRREFFKIDPGQARVILELIALENATPEIEREANSVDVQSQAAAKKLKAQKPNMDFIEMEIPIGSELKFTKADEFVEVISNKKVRYEDKEYSLTPLTQRLLDYSSPVNSKLFWTYEDKLLQDIYDRTYEETF